MLKNTRNTGSRPPGFGGLSARNSLDLTAPAERFQNNQFVMSNCRIFLKDTKCNNALTLVETKFHLIWDQVLRLDVICSRDAMPYCSICLEQDFISPHITKCGHVFCLPCFFRYLNYNVKNRIQCIKCPVCSVLVFKNDLRITRFQFVEPIKEIKSINLCLVGRWHNLASIEISEELKASLSTISNRKISSSLLDETSLGIQFTKFAICKRPDILWQLDLKKLTQVYELYIELEDFDAAIAVSDSINLLENKLENFNEEKTQNYFSVDLENVKFPEENAIDYGIMDFLEVSKSSLLFKSSYESSIPPPKNWNSDDPSSSFGILPTDNVGKYFTFYQSVDGQLCFLDPLQLRCIRYEYKSSYELPPLLLDLKVINTRSYLLNSHILERNKFLSYLPLNTPISFVEVEIDHLLSQATREHFQDMFYQRQQTRKMKKARSEQRERDYLQNLQVKETQRIRNSIKIHRSEDLGLDYDNAFPALSQSPTSSVNSTKSRLNFPELLSDFNDRSPSFESHQNNWNGSSPTYLDILRNDIYNSLEDTSVNISDLSHSQPETNQPPLIPPISTSYPTSSPTCYENTYPSLQDSCTLPPHEDQDHA